MEYGWDNTKRIIFLAIHQLRIAHNAGFVKKGQENNIEDSNNNNNDNIIRSPE